MKRNYDVSDAELFAKAWEFHQEYTGTYGTTFNEFDSATFHETFESEFKLVIVTAEEVPTDEVLVDEQAKETADLEEVEEECLDEISYASYFVKKISQDDPDIREEFGYDNLKKARANTHEMVLFMVDFIAKIAEYNERLVAVRYPATKLEELTLLLEELRKERSEQVEAKNDRRRMTTKRIRLNNRVWKKMALLADAVKYALPDDEVAQEIFTLPRPEQNPAL